MLFVIAQTWPCLLATLALGALVAWFLNRSTSTFVAKADLPDFGLFVQHGDLPKMPDLSGFARRIEIPSMPDLSHHALRSDLPDVSGFISAAALAPLAL